MTKIPSLTELLEAGAHFGHHVSRWHPKMAPHIFGNRSGIHIINIEETQKHLGTALDFLSGVVARGGNVLFVGTKQQAQGLVKQYAKEVGMPYVSERWLGGTLTNFGEIKRVVKRLLDLRDKREKGELKKYTKQEQVWIARDIEDMERKVGGIETMMQMPDAIFIVDIRSDKTALAEAVQKKIPVVALIDTNVNPRDVTYPIPANDDGVKSINLMLALVAEAIKDGKAQGAAAAALAALPKVEKKPAFAEASSGGEEETEETLVKEEAKAVVEDLDDKLAEEIATQEQEKGSVKK